jgi:hypothetical protein
MSEAVSQEAWNAVQRAALVVSAPERAAFEVRGGDRKTWLNGLVTCDMAKLGAGQAVYGLAVGPKGRILADLFVANEPDRIVLFAPREVRESLRTAFEHYLVMEDAETALVDDICVFVHGPRSSAIAEAARAAGAFAAPLDVTGRGGALVIVPSSVQATVDAAIDAALAEHGGMRAGDDRAWEAVRIAGAIPRWGVDFDATYYPQEASLEERAVSFQKGCYLGQEVICMLQMRGRVSRRLVPLEMAPGARVDKSANVQDEAGADVGKVTSASLSPDGSKLRALALVKSSAASPGARLRVAGETATVQALAGHTA